MEKILSGLFSKAKNMINQLVPKIKALILDMDGVLWVANQQIGNLSKIFDRIADLDLKVVFATNNSTQDSNQTLEKLAGFGIKAEPWQITNSASSVSHLMKKQFPNGGPVYIIGEIGLENTLNEAGFYHSENPIAVVAGFDRNFTFEKLYKATAFIRRGCPLYFTNPDTTLPTIDGLTPGAGSILAAIETASESKAIVAGKPFPAMFELALSRTGTNPEETLVVGDRLNTDIQGGQNAHCKTALVLSGVTTYEMATKWTPKIDLIAQNLTELIG